MSRRFTLLTALLLVSPASLALAELPVGVAAAPLNKTTSRQSPQTRTVAIPLKQNGIAKEPPTGAKPTEAIRFNTSLQWKTNPSTRTVFAIDADRRVWFIEPTSGWPYTLDGRGIVYTANALNGIVYSLGSLALWTGTVPYVLQNWALAGGVYTMASLDLYLSIYTNPAIEFFAYSDTYSQIWQYQNYFESSAFSAQTMSFGSGDDAVTPSLDASGTPSLGLDGLHGIHVDGPGSDNGGGFDFGAGADVGAGGDVGGGGDFGGGE